MLARRSLDSGKCNPLDRQALFYKPSETNMRPVWTLEYDAAISALYAMSYEELGSFLIGQIRFLEYEARNRMDVAEAARLDELVRIARSRRREIGPAWFASRRAQ
jgi:hypothetical protein